MSPTLPEHTKAGILRKPWFWLVGLLVVLVLVATVYGINRYQEGQRAAFAYLQETITVERRTVERTVSASGTIAADQMTQLFAEGSARIDEVRVSVGEEVNRDTVLLTYEVDLPSGGSASRELKAPFDGRVVDISTFSGDLVTPVKPLLEFSYRSTHIEFLASEAEVIGLAPGQEATLHVPSFDGGRQEFNGQVTFVDLRKSGGGLSPSGQVGETGYHVSVSTGSLPSELAQTLGLTIDVFVVVDSRTDVPALVKGAVQYDESDRPFVYLVPEISQEFIAQAEQTDEITEILETQPVELGFEGDEYIEIINGLREGDQVLLYVPAATAETIF